MSIFHNSLRRRQTIPPADPSPDGMSLPSFSGSASPPDTWVDISSTDYALRRRELMQMMSDLKSMGAEALIDLPSVVVIGGQSAGKSSLVEAVSGINVPRDSGTCTRCPMECTMSSHATSWSCSITLRMGFDSEGRDLPRTTTVPFGRTITNKDEVEVWLRRAQSAILNPNVPSSSFHAKTIEELRNTRNTLKFSRNVVCVSIEDPDATDLSFYDLPGLIQNEEAETVALVKSLAEHYTKKENTIILTTIPMSDDMENQQSMSLARAADPDGKRTIGVLTKPDTLGAGAINQRRKWVEIIEGRSADHTLRHGFYCVRLPDDAERTQRLSRAESQRRAAEYFDTTSPWRNVTDRHRFGIPGFVSDVSRLLIQLIEEALPRLREDIDKLLAKCMADFNALPPPLANDPQIEVLGRVNAFCDVFKSFVNGSHEDKRLAQRNRAHYAIFKRDIRGTAPDFRPYENPEERPPLDDTEGKMTLTERDPGVKMMGVHDISKVIDDSIGWELPNNVPYQAKANLIAQFIKLWVAPSERCLVGVNDVLDQVINTLITIHFGRFKVLEGYVGNLIRVQVDICKARAKEAVKTALNLETTPYYTQNTHYLQTLQEKWLAYYKVARHLDRSPYEAPRRILNPNHYYEESLESRALRALAEAGYVGLTVANLSRLLPPEPYEKELIVMADVRAYYQVAYKRVIDHIPLTIEHALHHALAEQLSQSLLTSLLTDVASGPNFSERMNELVSEDASIAQKRASLSSRKQRLSDIRRRLMTFSNST
ncbi:P-loop containing nucleoside triphosphate hydrolase protein [Suillus clintonianus]|uniref:P-loop containing nucleoside triphosphate hydrolase protein n=1 Tax=Suillus clintonianus TaxID=1904413 RepID=UPI001B86DB36|nr:P-loop containing nucleoside triphosphate hydrolase protein [Suillus clintonianus]KAG2148928.1 P-loop containing nucleoside triphosphate hydrolase protein [Suillus clintonianus]